MPTKKSALVVDDDPLLRSDTVHCLCADYDVHECDFHEAIPLLESARKAGKPYNLVVGDIYQSKPEPTRAPGIEIADWMRTEAYPAKVILVSGYTERGIANLNPSYGALKASGVIAGFLSKPYPAAALLALASGLDGKTVLVVDDDESVREANVGMLESVGYKVMAAASKAEAVGILAEGAHIDLLLTDKEMPGGSGIELIQQLRADANNVPAILISGRELTQTEKLDLEKVGNTAYLQKPCRSDELLSRIDKMLSASNARGL